MKEIYSRDKHYILNTYARYPILITRGSGAYVYDDKGNEYLDFLSGISVCNMGHSHPAITKALHEQLDTLIHCSNLYYTENQIKLAEKLSAMSFEGKTFFANSGTEANETALKFIRYRGNTIHKGKNVILSLRGSFHGRSLGSLSLTGQERFQKGFEPLLPSIHHIEVNNIKDLYAQSNQNLAGIIIEVIQGERGVYPMTADFVCACRDVSKKYNALLIIDEIQSGLGRTGPFLGYEHYGIQPDGYTLAKALGNGIPIGLFHIHKAYADLFQAGMHGSTFGGNPLATRAGLEVLTLLESEVLPKIPSTSNLLKQALQAILDRYPFIKEVRGRGLMLALETDVNARTLLDTCHEEGLLANAIREDTLRLLPPLIIGEKEVDLFYDKMTRVCKHF